MILSEYDSESAPIDIPVYLADTSSDDFSTALQEAGIIAQKLTGLDDAAEMLPRFHTGVLLVHESLLTTADDFIARLKAARKDLIICALLSETVQIPPGVSDHIDGLWFLNTPSNLLRTKLEMLIRHGQMRAALNDRVYKMYTVSQIAEEFSTSSTLDELRYRAVDLLCKRFNLSGVSIMIKSGENLRVHTGTVLSDGEHRSVDTTLLWRSNELLKSVVEGKNALVLDDLSNFADALPLHPIEKSHYALLLPLRHQAQVTGILALFSKTHPLDSESVIVFETLATHFVSAYRNCVRLSAQEQETMQQRQRLIAWQELTRLYESDQIAGHLLKLIRNTAGNVHIAVWMFDVVRKKDRVIIEATSPRLENAVNKLLEDGTLISMTERFERGMLPQTYHRSPVNDSATMSQLYDEMGSDTFILLPIAASLYIGGVLLGVDDERSLSIQDINVVESLAHSAGQTVERNILINATNNQAARLEAILRTIHEGTFFVDETDRVVFCTPQFTELTGIPGALIINQNYQHLIKLLASYCDKPEDVAQQLENAHALINDEALSPEHYPAVPLHLTRTDRTIYVEFLAIPGETAAGEGWIGVVREAETSLIQANRLGFGSYMEMLVEELEIPFIELRNSISLLRDSYTTFKPHIVAQMLNRINHRSQSLHQLWRNLTQLHRLDTGDLVPTLKPVDIRENLEAWSKSAALIAPDIDIQIKAHPPAVQVLIDETLIRLALSNVLNFFIQRMEDPESITVHIKPEEKQVSLIVQYQSVSVTDNTLTNIVNYTADRENVSTDHNDYLSLYIARRILEIHNGHLNIKRFAAFGIVVQLVLPIANAAPDVHTVTTTSRSVDNDAITAIVVESSANLLQSSYEYLKKQGHELVLESSASHAITSLQLVQTDLVIIEKTAETDAAFICQRIRENYDVPIMILAQGMEDTERIELLQYGADDIVSLPTDREEINVRMKNIAWRKHIASRVNPPLQIGDLYIDLSSRRVFLKDRLLHMTAKEYELLGVLAMNMGRILTHQQLLSQVWGPEYRDETQYLWVNVSRLRRKIEAEPDSPRYIHTEPGVGYVLREP